MATKRRRVWANWYPALGEAPAHWGTRLGAKSDARMAAQPRRRVGEETQKRIAKAKKAGGT